MISHLSPSQFVIRIFGGVRPLARSIGRSAASVSRWGKPKNQKGCDGRVPAKAQIIILEIAKTKSLDINPQDLIIGRNIEVKK